MNDRFRFRAFIDGSCYDEDGEDKDVSFLVYNVAFYGDGTIGASKDDLKEAIKKLELSAYEERTLWEYFIDNYGTFNSEWFVIDCNKIDQCTTLKDKNGNLIYENDVVAAPYIDPIFNQPWDINKNDDKAVVEYFKGCFVAYYPERSRKYLYDYENMAEVIGTVHTNPNLLEQSNDD